MTLKFVGLHSHDTFSFGDGFGFPEDHYNFILKNSQDLALATTNHGNLNSLGYMLQAKAALKKKGVDFHVIAGNEMYLHPDLDQWKKDKAEADQKKSDEKKKKKKQEEEIEETETKPASEDDLPEDLVVEDEEESKRQQKFLDPVKRRHHLVVLAQNQEGLQNLFKLTSWSYKEGFFKFPRVDFKMLEKHKEGLIISSSCLAGPLNFVIMRELENGEEAVMNALEREMKPLFDIFGSERAFVELQFNKIPMQKICNQFLVKFAQKHGFKLIATADSHYPSPDLWKERETLKLLGRQTKKQEASLDMIPNSFDDLQYHLFPKNGDQMFQSFLECNPEMDHDLIKEAIERTHHIAFNMIEPLKIDSSLKLPKRVYENNKTSNEKLSEMCLVELEKRGLSSNPVYSERLKKELDVICKKNYSDYFLLLKESIDEIEKSLFIGPGRGSAASSLISFLLQITKIDPIRTELIFERFLSEYRNEAPDSDQDCENREKVLGVLRKLFGVDSVVAITNFNAYQLKSLVKDVSRLHKIPFEEVNRVTSVMEDEAKPKIMEENNWDQKLYSLDFDNTLKFSPTFASFIKKYPAVAEMCKALFKQMKSIGKHAGGTGIVQDADQNMPLIKIRGEIQTPWSEGLTVKHLEQFGIIKYDFLALSTLETIRNCIELVLIKQGIEPSFENVKKFYDQNLHPEVVLAGDPDVLKEIYQKGRWINIFQFTEKGVQEFCQNAMPKTVGDISDVTALWRPGPLKGGANVKYLEAVNDPNSIKYDHPILEKILKKTKGLILYQEQFMQLANQLAGFSLLEADEVRKLLMKPVTSMATEMKQKRIEIGERFIKGCIQSGIKKSDAEDLWNEKILGFISYGFVKSLHEKELVTIYDSDGSNAKQIEMESVESGMFVRSRNEQTKTDQFVQVKQKHDHGVIEVHEITFDDGRKVRCTLDHKFRVEDGRMLPVWKIMKEGLNVVAIDVEK